VGPLGGASRDAWDLKGTSIRQYIYKKRSGRTFDHLGGRYGIISTFLVTWSIIEQKEALDEAMCVVLKDVDRAIDLGDKLLRAEVSVAILPWLEHNASLSVE
jgi:hypothetical protein